MKRFLRFIFYYFMKFILWPFFFIVFPFIRKGRYRIRHKGRGIVISNHQSGWDIIMLAYTVPRRIHFMAKAEMFENGFTNWLFRSLGTFPVNRENVSMVTIKHALKLLNDDKILAMFPEGSRDKFGEGGLREVKKGIAMFALKTKSPIIPTFIPRRPKMFRFNKLIIGETFDLSEFYDQKLTDEVMEKASLKIGEKLAQLRDKELARIEAKKAKKAARKNKTAGIGGSSAGEPALPPEIDNRPLQNDPQPDEDNNS